MAVVKNVVVWVVRAAQSSGSGIRKLGLRVVGSLASCMVMDRLIFLCVGFLI